jgi:type II restriction enzyme
MLNREETKRLIEISGKYYMPPVISRLNDLINQYGYKESFRYLCPTIQSAENEVLATIEEGKDISQTSKSVVGNIFSCCIEYLFLKAKESGEVREDVFMTSKKKFKDIVYIEVDGERQQPDMDLMFYTLNEDDNLKNLMILSLKTSIRERAGQTYKWKLLLEIATTDNSIKEKYNIVYPLLSTGECLNFLINHL